MAVDCFNPTSRPASRTYALPDCATDEYSWNGDNRSFDALLFDKDRPQGRLCQKIGREHIVPPPTLPHSCYQLSCKNECRLAGSNNGARHQ